MGDEQRLRIRMISAGIWLSVVLLVTGGSWIAFTWHRHHRGGLVAMEACAGVATAIIALVPSERIVAGRFREPFFLGWSLSLIAFTTIASGLDDGIRSPLVLTLFLTLVYAALSYPRWSVAVVSVVSLLAVLALSLIAPPRGAGPSDPVYLSGLMITLAVAGVMCVWQSSIQEQARAELRRVSRTDALTGALNRLGLEERLGSELRGAPSGGPVAFVMLDFDGFKEINDRDGHAAGDDLLRWAVAAMGGALRPGDALGRLGGDEFAIVLPGLGLAAAQDIAGRLQLVLSMRILASAGVATTDVDGAAVETLRTAADRRLYEAKRARPPQATPVA